MNLPLTSLLIDCGWKIALLKVGMIMFGLLSFGRLPFCRALIFLFSTFSFAQADEVLMLDKVLSVVKENDYRIKQLSEESKAYQAESEAASYLPDPTIFAAIQSLPTDSFAFDQEPMTQLKVGLRQMFPKGRTLEIRSEISDLKSGLQLMAGELRWLERKQLSEQAWLEAWYWQKTLQLLDEDKIFLAQVQEFIRSLYEVGAKDQSDLIGADLELLKLSEKRIDAERNYQIFRQQLNTLANQTLKGASLSASLPQIQTIDLDRLDRNNLNALLAKHPGIKALAQEIMLSSKQVGLVEQDFEPAWGLELSYGLRDGENMDGSDRADFFSAGVSLQLPLFSNEKQGKSQLAAKQRSEVAQIKRDEALSQMKFEIDSLIQQYRYVLKQRKLYETDILPTLAEQRKSALQSYEADQGNFRLVMNLFLKEQGAKNMHQRLRVNEQKLISSLNYQLGLDNSDTNVNEGAR